jgi:hypothetical protein
VEFILEFHLWIAFAIEQQVSQDVSQAMEIMIG